MDQTLITQIPTSPQLVPPAEAAAACPARCKEYLLEHTRGTSSGYRTGSVSTSHGATHAPPVAHGQPAGPHSAQVRRLLSGPAQRGAFSCTAGRVDQRWKDCKTTGSSPVPAVLPAACRRRPLPLFSRTARWHALFNWAPRACNPITTFMCTQHTCPPTLTVPLAHSPAGSAVVGATTRPLGPPPTQEGTPQTPRMSSSSPTACWPASWCPWRG